MKKYSNYENKVMFNLKEEFNNNFSEEKEINDLELYKFAKNLNNLELDNIENLDDRETWILRKRVGVFDEGEVAFYQAIAGELYGKVFGEEKYDIYLSKEQIYFELDNINKKVRVSISEIEEKRDVEINEKKSFLKECSSFLKNHLHFNDDMNIEKNDSMGHRYRN